MSGPYQPMASGIASLTARRYTVCRSTRSTRDGCSTPNQSVAVPPMSARTGQPARGRPSANRCSQPRVISDLCGSAHGSRLLMVSVRSAAKSHSGECAFESGQRGRRCTEDTSGPGAQRSQAMSSTGFRAVPPRASPSHLSGRGGPHRHLPLVTFPVTQKALSLSGKGLDLRKLVAGGGFEPPTSGL